MNKGGWVRPELWTGFVYTVRHMGVTPSVRAVHWNCSTMYVLICGYCTFVFLIVGGPVD